jgi:hypothetical protein
MTRWKIGGMTWDGTAWRWPVGNVAHQESPACKAAREALDALEGLMGLVRVRVSEPYYLSSKHIDQARIVLDRYRAPGPQKTVRERIEALVDDHDFAGERERVTIRILATAIDDLRKEIRK